MKQLIKKEFMLGWKWYNYLFFTFPILILIPNYPVFTGMMYVFFFVTTLFPGFMTNGDYKFMTGLPIRRKDIVVSKYFDILFGQLGTLIISIPMLILKAKVIGTEGTPLMEPNAAVVGMICIDYAVFNLIFMPVFFTELKLPKSILLSLTGLFVSMALLEVLVQVIPALRTTLDTLDGKYVLWQVLTLFIGIIIYLAGSFVAYRIACKKFNRYNM